MSTQQYITIRAPYSNREVDLEVPSDEAINSFLPDLVKVINWPEIIEGSNVSYQFTNENGQKLDQTCSLKELEVDNFEVLWLNIENHPGKIETVITSTKEPPQDESDRHKIPSPPVWASIPIESPSLVSAQGLVFILGNSHISIGRTSREFKPDIDLTELDKRLLSSRKHAEIVNEGKTYFLIAFRTTNGTFINSVELQHGEKKALKDGDKIQFGFRGVELIYKSI